MFRSHTCLCILCALIGLALSLLMLLTPSQPSASAAQPPAAKPRTSFIGEVAPILRDNCFACHDAKKKKGKLDMTTFANLRKGGSHDDPIEAGLPDQSLLINLLCRTDEGRMPPREAGDALAAAKIETIKQWIKEGAAPDAGLDPGADLFRELRIRWQPPEPPLVYRAPVAVTALAFTPDNKALVIGGYHELTIWSVDTGKLTSRMRTRAERAYAMAFLPDGKLVVAGGRPGQEGDMRVYDPAARTGKAKGGVTYMDGVHDRSVFLTQLLDCDDSVLALALSLDGKQLAAGGCDRIVRVWDVSAGWAAARLEQSIANHADWVCGLAFSPDGKYLLTASRDTSAKIWDLAAKHSVATFPDHKSSVSGVALSHDGLQAMSVGEDGVFRIWHATDQDKKLGKQIKTGKGGHAKAVFRLAVQNQREGDSQNLLAATSSADGTVKLWDLAAGSATRTLKGLSDFVYAVAISPDGMLVAAGDCHGEVRIWEAVSGRVVLGFNASPGFVAALSK
jgi:Planctomycete cytochrome C/WD domain, G-beta repeat